MHAFYAFHRLLNAVFRPVNISDPFLGFIAWDDSGLWVHVKRARCWSETEDLEISNPGPSRSSRGAVHGSWRLYHNLRTVTFLLPL